MNKLILKNLGLLIVRLMAIMALYQISRLFYYFYNIDYFTSVNLISYINNIFIGSLKFDASAIIYTNLLLILLSLFPSNYRTKDVYKKILKFIFILCNFIGLIVNIFDTLYYPFSKNRVTMSSIKEFSNEKNPLSFVLEIALDYWFVIPIGIVLILILNYIFKSTLIHESKSRHNLKSVLLASSLGLLFFTFSVFVCRGSFVYKNRPITISNAGKYANSPNEIALIINTPFSLIRTINKKDLKRKEYFNEDEILNIYNTNYYPNNSNFSKKNIVVIILESMATEYYGAYNENYSYTPFLDSLINVSYSSYNSFSNGRKSIDVMPSVFASIPNTTLHFALSKYCTNNMEGIGTLLMKEGYSTSFFHGAPNGSMGFQSMASLCGLKEYFGMDDYDNDDDFDGLWGIWDDKFFNYFADKINTIQEPFLTGIFSCSSHHPFKIPKEFNNKFIEGKHPMHKCVQYTDYSLKLFFNKIKKTEWFKNTLFVITADHTNVSFNEKYHTSLGIFRVPIIFYDPSSPLLAKKSREIIQHIDIMPSILSYINYPNSFKSFGSNIFDKSKSNFAINYNNNFQLVMDNRNIIYSELNDEITNIYDLEKDPLFTKNIVSFSNIDSLKIYKQKIKAFIQTYNNSMINNSLQYGN